MSDVIETHSVDPVLERAVKFARKLHPDGGMSNLYIIRKYDMDGNQIDELYGMNLMTDWAMSRYFNINENFPTNLYVGQGTGIFDYKTKTMVDPIVSMQMQATNSDTNKYYGYPMYYASAEEIASDVGSGLVTCVMKYLSCYYDYNISGITDSIAITEYGIGTDINNLWTHSWVYDSEGTKTYITKEPNTRLTFDVYLCMSYFESLIISGYKTQDEETLLWHDNDYAKDDSRFTIITRCDIFMNKMLESEIGTFKRNNVRVNRRNSSNPTYSRSTFANGRVETTSILPEFTMYQDTTKNTEGYIDGFYQLYTGFLTVERQQLEEPEVVDLKNYTSKDPFAFDGFSRRFGAISDTPITQLTCQGVYTFNSKGEDETGERWCVPAPYHNTDNHWYTETSFATTFAVPIYYTNNNVILTMYVFQNLRPDDPILSLDVSTVTLYATNKYWNANIINDDNGDPDKGWVLIVDRKHIPEKCRTARYWIIPTNTLTIVPTRESGVFYLKGNVDDTDNGISSNPVYSNDLGSKMVCDNYEYGWFKMGNKVYVPSRGGAFTIGTSTGVNTDSFTYGKWLLTFTSNTNGEYYQTDMSNVTVENPTIDPLTIPFTATGINPISCYRTESGTGIVSIQTLTSGVNNFAVFDLRSAMIQTPVVKSDSLVSACIWGTNKIAYIKKVSDVLTLCIYNVDTQRDETYTYNLTEQGIAEVKYICGHTNYIWITNGSTYSYMVDVITRTISSCASVIPISSNIHQWKMTAVDDAFVVYNYTNTSFNDDRIVNIATPNDVKTLSAAKLNSIPSSGVSAPKTIRLKYINMSDDGTMGTLVMISSIGYHSSISGSANYVYDLGQWMYDGTVKQYSKTMDECSSFCLYGNYVMYTVKSGLIKTPLVNMVPIRILGTTNTITALHNIKHISNKRYTIEYTNIPQFGYNDSNGKPPGRKN